MKPRLVIVGAGLGGCLLADGLAESWDITVVELGSHAPPLQARVLDTARPAVLDPHICSGLGGTTALWHNCLVEVDEDVFRDKWPFPKSELAPYYARAYPKLAGVPQSAVTAAARTLRRKYAAVGFPEDHLGQGLFYPRRRLNVWDSLDLKERVTFVEGEVTALLADGDRRIRHLLLKSADQQQTLSADAFVLAAGGLGTPLLLQRLAEHLPPPALQQAGCSYEDHPSAWVGEVTLDAPFHEFWNYSAPGTDGHLRLPLVITQDRLQVSFQLRPGALHDWTADSGANVKRALTALGRQPSSPQSYFRLLSLWPDVADIVSRRIRARLPTDHYSLLMVAEQPSADARAVWRDRDKSTIYRQWDLPVNYIATLQGAIHQVLQVLGPMTKSADVLPHWSRSLASSAHHSGTARMAASPGQGVCDSDGRVRGLDNLYVCDGSLIPASGYANTGLTIAALAIRMADHMRGSIL